MQQINKINSTKINNINSKKKATSSNNSSFVNHLSKNQNSEKLDSVFAMTTISDIMFEHNIDEKNTIEKEKKRVKKIFSYLEELHNQILNNNLDQNLLLDLQNISSSIDKEYLQNSELKSLIDQIELRAAVEVAKYSVE